MEKDVELSEVFLLYLCLENHYHSYSSAKIYLTQIAKDEPKMHLMFMDAYDVCDLVYPKSFMKKDRHYDIVRKLWLEIFALCDSDTIPFKTQAVIAPPAAYEVLEFAYDRIVATETGFVLAKTEKSDVNWLSNYYTNWKKYHDIKPFLSRSDLDEHIKILLSLYRNEKLVEFSQIANHLDIFKKSKNIHDLISAVTPEVDYEKGMRYFECRRPNQGSLANAIDMCNFVTFMAYKKAIINESENLSLITSHSGMTLGAWRDSWALKASKCPICATLAEYILITSMIQTDGNIDEARDFVAQGQLCSRDILQELEIIPEIRTYFDEARSTERKRLTDNFSKNKNRVNLNQRTLYKIEEWQARYAKIKLPYLAQSEPDLSLDRDVIERLLTDKTYQKDIFEEANTNAQDVFYTLEQEGILTFDRIFVPENPKFAEMLRWLKPN